jgi:two-component system nitrogen regulation response regulator GlnG
VADVLVIDDQDRTLEMCRRSLPEHRYRGPARCWSEAWDLLQRGRGKIDLILLDVHLDRPVEELLGGAPEMDERAVERLRRRQGLLVLQELRRREPEIPVIVMTARDDIPLDLEDLGDEEYTFFLDDEQLDARSLRAQMERVLRADADPEVEGPVFWGKTLGMRRIRQQLAVLARGGLPVFLLGPTGTGKSLLARHFLHERSGRSGRFVAVDLATVPPDLMSAHLFGSMRGAYTGSVADRVGAFEAAHGGTLFLDEIGNLPLDAQKLLLSVLQEGRVTRIGDTKEREVDVKLVVATCDDLGRRVREGTFRADLFMRLNPAAAVRLPSLEQRRLDLDRLIGHAISQALTRPALREIVAQYRNAAGLGRGDTRVVVGADAPEPESGILFLYFPERTARLLRAHSWPGNLREFAMVAENAALFALAESLAVARSGGRADVVQVRPKILRDLLTSTEPLEAGGVPPLQVQVRAADTLNKVALDVERQYFTALFRAHQGDFGAMAVVLLGDGSHARKVQLRFNQLGLKVRELRETQG